jgi:primosomal protein N'
MPNTIDHFEGGAACAPPVLRSYQQEGVDRIRAQFANGINRVCYQLPTGGGKTVVFAYIVAAAVAKGSRAELIMPDGILLRHDRNYWQVASHRTSQAVPA